MPMSELSNPFLGFLNRQIIMVISDNVLYHKHFQLIFSLNFIYALKCNFNYILGPLPMSQNCSECSKHVILVLKFVSMCQFNF